MKSGLRPTTAEVVKGRRPAVDTDGRPRCRNTPVAGIGSPPQTAPAVRRHGFHIQFCHRFRSKLARLCAHGQHFHGNRQFNIMPETISLKILQKCVIILYLETNFPIMSIIEYLTYSPWLKPGDSWIQTAFACLNAGLTIPLQRRSMPQPSRCSLRHFCPDHERHRNADTSISGRANLLFPDSDCRRYGRFASLHSTDQSFGYSFLFCSPDIREFSQTPQSRSRKFFFPIVSASLLNLSPQCTQAHILHKLSLQV